MMTETTTTNTATNPQVQEQVTEANPPARRRASPNVVVLALFVGLLGGLLIRAGTGCTPTEEAPAPDAEGDAQSEPADEHASHEAEGHEAHAHDDHEPATGEGPQGTTLLGNANCPVMGGAIDEAHGVEYNGWWVYFCCPGCDGTFLDEPEAYAAGLEEQTGIDVRLTPEEAEQAADWSEGPNGTRDVQNERDPVTGEATRASVGVEVGGWWVRLASPDSVRPFVDNLEQYAAELAEATGVDVRKAPDAQPTRPDDTEDAHEENADAEHAPEEEAEHEEAVQDLGNERCPVMDNPVAEDEYVVHNGWKVRFCCPGCDSLFLDDPERYADGLKEATGHDIRVAAE